VWESSLRLLHCRWWARRSPLSGHRMAGIDLLPLALAKFATDAGASPFVALDLVTEYSQRR
jgi:hypothetical protein